MAPTSTPLSRRLRRTIAVAAIGVTALVAAPADPVSAAPKTLYLPVPVSVCRLVHPTINEVFPGYAFRSTQVKGKQVNCKWWRVNAASVPSPWTTTADAGRACRWATRGRGAGIKVRSGKATCVWKRAEAPVSHRDGRYGRP